MRTNDSVSFIAFVIIFFSAKSIFAQELDIETNIDATVPSEVIDVQDTKIEQEFIVKEIPQPPKLIKKKKKDISPEIMSFQPFAKQKEIQLKKADEFVTFLQPQPAKKIKKPKPLTTKISAFLASTTKYDDNIFTSNRRRENDVFVTLAPAVQALIPLDQSQINKLLLRSSASFTRYNDVTTSNGDDLINLVSFTHRLDTNKYSTRSIAANYLAVASYDQGFEEHNSTLHRPTIKFSHDDIPIGNGMCVVARKEIPCNLFSYSLQLRRSIIQRVDNVDNSSFVAGASLTSNIPTESMFLPGTLQFKTSVTVTGVIYDDFSEGDREELTFGISGGLTWKPNPSLTVSSSLDYDSRDSSISRFDYDRFLLSGGLKLSVKLN